MPSDAELLARITTSVDGTPHVRDTGAAVWDVLMALTRVGARGTLRQWPGLYAPDLNAVLLYARLAVRTCPPDLVRGSAE